MSDAVTELFIATDCVQGDSNRQGPEEEHMQVHHLPLRKALELVDEGEITDAKTVVLLLLAERMLSREDSFRE